MWLRLRQIALVARRLAPVADDLNAVLGLEVCFRDPGVGHFGLENALFPVGDQFLEVVAPVREGTTAERYLDRRGGDGGYMVITQCDDHAPRRRRMEELGVRVVHQFENDRFRNAQMHPKDTGGSFFEIDEQLGERAHDRDGPWEPAGGDGWQPARRTERVGGITAAEVQADDPEKVAARWSEIAEIDLGREGGHPVLPLDGAVVRFVPVTDGRGEGLGGLDLRVADRAAVVAAAEARGCVTGDGRIALAGVRLNLA